MSASTPASIFILLLFNAMILRKKNFAKRATWLTLHDDHV